MGENVKSSSELTDNSTGSEVIDRLLTPDTQASVSWFESVERNWQGVPVSPKVPEFSRQRIERAKDLFRFSYFRHGFQDAALLYMIATYEEALRQAVGSKKSTFEKLLDAGIAEGVCPERHKDFKLTAMRQVRNALAHGSALLGNMISQSQLLLVIDLINCVYDENARREYPPLFERRRRELEAMRKLQDAIISLPPDTMRPGDGLLVLGQDELYPQGTYECLRCHERATLEQTQRDFSPCKNCGHDVYLYRPFEESRGRSK
jgi:DNA-directed RNA polymerase subunit RPC12/RpoP